MLLHYTSIGSGRPIILIHGYLSDSHYWQTIIPQLSKHHRVICIDLLGFGKSPKPHSSNYSLEDHVSAVRKTIQHVIGNESYILVGHSMGALVSGKIANDEPKRVKRLVLLNMPIFTSQSQARRVFSNTSLLYKTMLYTPIGRIGWLILKTALKSPLIRTVPRSLRPIAKSSSSNTHTSRKQSLKNTIETTNGRSILTNITVETQFIGGIRDRSIYKENLDSFTIPSNISISWHDSGHHTITTAVDLVIAIIAGSALSQSRI